MIIGKVISGGQTGADMAGLRAARTLSIPTGGLAPRGYLTELGPRPDLLKKYKLKEHPSSKYPPRTVANIGMADITLIFAGSIASIDAGSHLTISFCFKLKKPVFAIYLEDANNEESMKEVVSWVKARYKGKPLTINIAGNRESKSPGIERWAKTFLIELFLALENETKS